MKYLIDTDWVVDHLQGKQQAIDLIFACVREGAAISLITVGEVYEGIYFGYNPERHERGFRNFLRSFPVLSLNRSTMKRFARLRGDLRQRSQLISDPDILIAATAIEHDHTLVSRNKKHFERISQLQLYR